MHIGKFRKVIGGYAGRLQTLDLDLDIRILPAEQKASATAPDWHVVLARGAARIDVGCGWTRNSQKAGPYIALLLDCPSFARPLRANLMRSERDPAAHVLLWSRSLPRPREARQ